MGALATTWKHVFAKSGHPTPKGRNPADQYVTMVNDELRDHARSVEEGAQSHEDWQKTNHLGGPEPSAFFSPPK